MLDWDDDERSPFVPPKFCNKMNNKAGAQSGDILLGDILKDLYTDRPNTPTPPNSFVYDEEYQESVYTEYEDTDSNSDPSEEYDAEAGTDDYEDNSSEFNEHIQDDKMKKFMYT